MVQIPAAFLAAAEAREGAAGRAWAAGLTDTVADFCARWALQPAGRVRHGYLGMVVPVRRGSGDLAALKVTNAASAQEESAALSAWGGSGAALLLDSSPGDGVLLLEWLDAERSLLSLGLAEALEVAGGLLRRLAIPAPTGFPTVREYAATLALGLPRRWQESGRPFSRRTLDRALASVAELSSSGGELLINHDLHFADVLAGTREPWLVVDPKVLVGNPEFGVAQLLWTRFEDNESNSGVRHAIQILAGAGRLDPEQATAWTFVRTVDYWLWGLSVGLTEDPARCSRIVEQIS